MIKSEQLDSYRKKFEEISSTRKSHLREKKIPANLKDWDELVYKDYPELVASLIYSLQEFMDYQTAQISEEELHNQNAQVNWADYEHFFGSKD